MTALVAIGYVPQAKYVLSKFGWSQGFWQQNPGILNYANKGMEEVIKASNENEQFLEKGFQRQYDYPSDSDSEECEVHTGTE